MEDSQKFHTVGPIYHVQKSPSDFSECMSNSGLTDPNLGLNLEKSIFQGPVNNVERHKVDEVDVLFLLSNIPQLPLIYTPMIYSRPGKNRETTEIFNNLIGSADKKVQRRQTQVREVRVPK